MAPAGKRHLSSYGLLGCLLALLLHSSPARGDAAQARVHYEKARTYFQVDEYRKALEEFKAAHIEKPDPAYLYNIAECYRRLGENQDAVVYYRRFLALGSPQSPLRPDAERRIAELEAAPKTEPVPAVIEPAPAATAVEPAPAPAPTPPPTPPPSPIVPPPVAPEPPPAAPAAVVVASVPAPDQPPPASPPLYKRGWFIAAVGVALIAGGVGIWAATSSGGGDVPSTPLGNQRIFALFP